MERTGMLERRIRLVCDDPRRFYQPHARQRDFHALGATCRERVFLAGNRVGKTFCGAAEVAFHLTGLYPSWWNGVRFTRPVCAWAAGVSKEATRDVLCATYLGDGRRAGLIPRWLITGVTRKSGVSGALDEVRVGHVSGGVSTLGFKSFDQGRESFQGTARDVVHLDEEPDIGIYEECLLRTMTSAGTGDGMPGGHLLLTMTPLLGLTEMVGHALEKDGVGIVRAGWQDAAHLDKATVARLRASLRPHEVQAREFGVPQLGRGRVFPVDEDALRCARFNVPGHWRRCFGLDFGWSNPTAAVWLAWDVEHDVVYLTDCYAASERTPAEHTATIMGRTPAWVPGVCDPAGQAANARDGQSLVLLYAQAGLRLESADNEVEAGLMALLERMRDGRFKVFGDLEDWWREFRIYRRDGRGKIVKKDDHLLDATRYAVMSGLAPARAGPVQGLVRPVVDWARV